MQLKEKDLQAQALQLARSLEVVWVFVLGCEM